MVRNIMIRRMMSYVWRTRHEKGKVCLNNSKWKFCGKKVFMGKVQPSDHRINFKYPVKIQFACTWFLKPIELLIVIITHARYAMGSESLKMKNIIKGEDLQLGPGKELRINKTQQNSRNNWLHYYYLISHAIIIKDST